MISTYNSEARTKDHQCLPACVYEYVCVGGGSYSIKQLAPQEGVITFYRSEKEATSALRAKIAV